MEPISKDGLIAVIKTRRAWDLNSVSDCPYAIALWAQGYDDVGMSFTQAECWDPDQDALVKVAIPEWYQALVSITMHAHDSKKTPSAELIELLNMPEDDLMEEGRSLRREGIFGPLIGAR